jgi:hypothetical protein
MIKRLYKITMETILGWTLFTEGILGIITFVCLAIYSTSVEYTTIWTTLVAISGIISIAGWWLRHYKKPALSKKLGWFTFLIGLISGCLSIIFFLIWGIFGFIICIGECSGSRLGIDLTALSILLSILITTPIIIGGWKLSHIKTTNS